MKRIVLAIMGFLLVATSGNTQISTTDLALWLKADVGVQNASGLPASNTENVQVWEDQSSNGNDAIQLTTGNQPQFIADDGTGSPSVRFSGESLQCADNTSLNPNELTIFIVGKYSLSGSGAYQSFLMKTPDDSWTAGGYGVSQSGSSDLLTGWVNAYNTTSSVGYTNFSASTNVLFSMVYAPGSLVVYNNGVSTIASASAPVLSTSNVPLIIGSSPGGYDLDGDISEIIIYGSALSNSEREDVENYLRTKYDLSGGGSVGAVWEAMNSGTVNPLLGIHFPTASTGYAVGTQSILKSDDAGMTWSSQTFPVSTTFGAVHFRDALNGMVAGNSGNLLVTADGGINWESATTNVTTSLWGVCNLSPNVAIAVGEFGTIIRSTDGGMNWSSINAGTTSSFWAVNFYDANNGIAVGNGVVRTTTDGGLNWTSTNVTGGPDLRGVWYLSANTAVVVGLNGMIYKTTDNGVTWTPRSSGTSTSLYAVHFLNASLGLACGDDGTILRTIDGGETWSEENSGTNHAFRGAAMASDTVGVVDGFNGSIRRAVFETVGIPSLQASEDWSVYPNPASDYLYLEVDAGIDVIELVLFDLSGAKVRAVGKDEMATPNRWEVNVQNLKPGTYLCCLTTSGGIITKKLVIQ